MHIKSALYNKKNKRSYKQNNNNLFCLRSSAQTHSSSLSFPFERSVFVSRIEENRWLCYGIWVGGEKGMSQVGSSQEEIVTYEDGVPCWSLWVLFLRGKWAISLLLEVWLDPDLQG